MLLTVLSVFNVVMFYYVSPFAVEPMEGSLGVGEYMQLNIDFEPKKVGDHTGNLNVSYNTGESWSDIPNCMIVLDLCLGSRVALI